MGGVVREDGCRVGTGLDLHGLPTGGSWQLLIWIGTTRDGGAQLFLGNDIHHFPKVAHVTARTKPK